MTPMKPESRRRVLQRAGILTVLTIFLLFAVEGFSSFAIIAARLLSYQPPAPPHNRASHFDPQIGWVGTPNVDNPNHFGKGIFVKTDSHGFRSKHEIAAQVPAGKLRIVCSGDSFTFGSGVDNDHDWCEMLEQLDSRIEAVNMGQIGYGVDQAYLWYKRNAGQVKHDVHLFAFIGDDFRRMANPDFNLYSKPVLDLEGDQIVARNVPLPEGSMRRRLSPLEKLQTLELLRKAMGSVVSRQSRAAASEQKSRKVALRIFEDLQKAIQDRGGILALVYLPEIDDCRAGKGFSAVEEMKPYIEMLPERRAFLKREAEARNIPFFDLTERFCSLGDQAESLFLREPMPSPFLGRLGHYNEAGNRLVAEQIVSNLLARRDFTLRVQSLQQAVTPEGQVHIRRISR